MIRVASYIGVTMSTAERSGERRPPAIKDVALLAGVSLGTVSNVLNNPGLVRESTRQKVREAIATLGWTPNSAARFLAAGSGETIGFVAVDLSNSYFVDIAKGIEEEADKDSHMLLLANSDVDLEKQTAYLSHFERARVEGIILAPLDAPLTAPNAIRARGARVVLVNWPGDEVACGVVVDEVLGGRLAMQHLLDQGRKRLVFVGGPLKLSAIQARLDGAQRAVADTPGATLQVLETDKLTVPEGLEVGTRLAEQVADGHVDGIFAAADALASGILQTLLLRGAHVPHDVAVVGYDDNHFADSSTLPLTTVGQPGREMGQLAMDLLRAEIAQGESHVHETRVLPPHLIPRASSVAAPHPR